jgi:hypothetical protein
MQGVDSPYAWWRLAAAMTLSAFGAVGMWGVVMVFPALQAEFGASRAEVSFSYTTTMLGGWMGGALFDLTGSYRAAFSNGIAWNALNAAIVWWLLTRQNRRLVFA